MKKFLCSIALGLGLFSHAQDWKTDDQYIQNFAKYAVEEMELYKIPASITLAQGILETGGGQSRLAREGKNHFGIKCKENWTGKTMRHTDDAPNECFRVYDDPRESYRDHSLFLTTRKYYVGLFKLDMKDYRAWAHGLKKAGYATNPQYAHILINRIEKYKLYEFDNIKSDEVEAKLQQMYPGFSRNTIQEVTKPAEQPQTAIVQTPPPAPQETKTEQGVATPPAPMEAKPENPAEAKQPETPIDNNNETENTEELDILYVKNHPNAGLKYIVLTRDMELSELAKKHNLRASDIRDYNELKTSHLKKNQIIFLEAKKSYGSRETHKVRRGEKMYGISQMYGIKLSHLYLKNRMEEGEEPREGDILYLQKKKPRR